LSKPRISVIIPTQFNSSKLDSIYSFLVNTPSPVEVIIVAHSKYKDRQKEYSDVEQVLFIDKQGRGHSLLEGLKIASGEIILILHDDTLLPKGWDQHIIDTMENPSITGGAFSLKFNMKNWKLDLLIILSNQLFKVTGELWGDRAIFFRKSVLINHWNLLNVPIMEDVRLSRFLKKQGRTVILKQAVITDAKSFQNKGIIKHTLNILRCRFLQFLKISPQKIYRFYYR